MPYAPPPAPLLLPPCFSLTVPPVPIMKEHHLSVVTLEEYEPNREFVGRNFNAGEVIQLVLKSVHAPHRWLPFRYVQMVMMHELAHCTHMHHARAFWVVRDAYAAAMTALWEKGYTGEGIWGRGATLDTGAWERDVVGEEEPLPAHLCGGTYRSRGRGGRKRKPKRSWKEQKERRIAKKFGVNGMALGADEAEKVKLEGGKKVVGRPRVAGSARGRELRAAAALARFDKQKVEDVKSQGEDEEGEETESGSEYEVYLEEEEKDDAVDLDGKKMKDGDGGAMVKVCEDEDGNDPSARNERDELRSVFTRPPGFKAERDGGRRKNAADAGRPRVKTEPESSSSSSRGRGRGRSAETDMLREVTPVTTRPLRLHDISHIRDAMPPTKPTLPTRKEGGSRPVAASSPSSSSSSSLPPTAATPIPTTRPAITIHRLAASLAPKRQRPAAAPSTENGDAAGAGTCPLCSLENDAAAVRCAACGNVLRADAVQGVWRCGGAGCEGTGYLNAGDCGVCGLCGRRKP
ncbi:WLM domain containing protein [Beauveria brongniartii RCEF 3172]|uniref:WLM domain containing protein n=1 Tax=Beauveria brongniartii RCEF 3172 TaxID=1081107 RepID=A0A167AS54_9HYPO|nr:WLM domain containing protein [Beauveria brongniartii RCEF 3172]